MRCWTPSDRDSLLAWLLERPLAHYDSARHDLLVHAGLVPQWHAQQAAQLAGEVEQRAAPRPSARCSRRCTATNRIAGTNR